jgi:Arm DNA-binding domain
MAIHRLKELVVQNKKKPGLYGDGGGLYLQVTKGKDDELRRSWIFRYAVPTNGPDEPAGSPDKRKKRKERKMGLGSLDTVGLAEARDKALECRKLRDKGLDPIEEREKAKHEAALKVVKRCCLVSSTALRRRTKPFRSSRHKPRMIA